MNEQQIDYSNTVIYKIQHKFNPELLYIGHTVNFVRRVSLHKHCINNVNCVEYNFKVYRMMRENGGWNNFMVSIIEYYPCDNERQATCRENQVKNQLNATMNSNNPFVDDDDKLDNYKLYKHKWRKRNRSHINKYHKTWRDKQKQKKTNVV